MRRDLRKAPHDGRSSGYCQRDTTGDRSIRQVAQSTGISFEHLLTTVKIESNFNPSAQASTSSTKG
jgi:hypothetical protein